MKTVPRTSFAVEDGDGENTVYIYYRQQSSGTRIFQISYRVENAVKLYADVGEFFWNLTAETGISLALVRSPPPDGARGQPSGGVSYLGAWAAEWYI